MRKLLISLLCVIMVVCFMPTMAFAADSTDSVQEVGTFQELKDALANGGKIKLKENITMDNYEWVNPPLYNSKIVLDLGGHKLLGNTNMLLLKSGSMEVKNGTIEMLSGNGGACIWIYNSAKLTVNADATIKSTGDSSFAISFDGGCRKYARCTVYGNLTGTNKGSGLTINGGVLSENAVTVTIAENAVINADGIGLYLAGSGKTTVTDNASITGVVSGIEVRSGELTVSGNAKITGTATPTTTKPNGSGTTTDGAGIAVAQHTTKQPITVKIEGGTIEGHTAVYESNAQNNPEEALELVSVEILGGNFEATKGGTVAVQSDDNKLIVKGGTFSTPVDPAYLPEGTTTKTNDEGKYVLAPADNAVAQVGEAGFSTIEAAVEAAGEGDVVQLYSNVTEDVVIPAGKTITLDLNGKKLTNNNSDTITVKKGASLTITGEGTVDNVTHARGAIFNEGKVVLKGGTYDRSLETGTTKTDSGQNTWYTICNHGEMEIFDGVTVQTAKNDNELGRFSSLFDNGYSSYGSKDPRAGYVAGTNAEKPTLTIHGGTFQGGLNTIKNDDAATLTIENGTFQNFYQAVVLNHNIATIKGGTFTAAAAEDETYGVYNCGCAADHDLGTLTITDGTFTGADYAVADVSNQPAEVKISGGTFEGEKLAIVKDAESKSTISVTGGTFSSDVKEYMPEVDKETAPADRNYVKYIKGDTYIVVAKGGTEPAHSSGKNTWTWDKEQEAYVESYVSSGYTPSAPTDNVTNQPGTQGTGTTEATAPTTTADMSNTTTVKTESKVDAATGETKNVVTSTTTVDNTTAEKIIDKAVENKSEEVIIDTTTSTPAATEAAQVGIPTATLEAISEKTDADVNVKTDVAEVTMDNKTAGEIAEQATGTTVHIIVEKTKEEATKVEFELKVVDSNGTVISDFNGGNVAVTVKVPTVMKDKELVCVYIDDNGKVSKVNGQKNADGTYTFVTGHFSAYAIMTEEEADAAIAAQVDELLKGFDDIDLVARSVRTSKGNVKVTLKVDKEGQTLIKELKEAGYTVKYHFYRSTKKSAGYVSKMLKGTKTYTNTYGKKGTNYYYKARVQVYDAEGKLIAKTSLKDCKYASRLWKK